MSAVAKRSGGHTIGTVLTMLKADFPDLTISKIRFLENEGLVTPQRARNSGYRLFSAGDVERLRLILRAQRDAYLPLKVIAEKLDDGSLAASLDRKAEAESGAARHLSAVVDLRDDQHRAGAWDGVDAPQGRAAVPSDVLPQGPVTKSQLMGLAAIDAHTLDVIENAELLKRDRLGRYAPESVPICRAAAGLLAFGIDQRHWGSFRAAASRESGSVERAVAHKTDPGERAEAIEALVSSYAQLHRWLLTSALAD